MAERSETAVGATTGGPRADREKSEHATESTAPLSAEALAEELAAMDSPADASTDSAPEVEPGDPASDVVDVDDTAESDDADQADQAEDAGEVAESDSTDQTHEADAEEPDEASDATPAVDPADKDAAADSEDPAEKATEDATEDATGAAAEASTDAPVAEVPAPPAPERHSGDRIASRYRLEECITHADAFSSWRAMDEKLRRAVGIHLLSTHHPRAKAVLVAARQAALMSDPRFVQVLDAVEDGDIVYIVREWLPDATGLDKLLLPEPLEPYEAYQLVRQLSEALSAAHRRGLSHLRLTPAAVLRTDSGQYRIDGLAVNAALRGIKAEDKADAARQDTRAISALLFAALTNRWPFPEGHHGLRGLPRNVGIVPAEQVRAGVNRGLSDLTARTLCATPGGKLEPIATPDELVKAVVALPKVRQPAPEPLVLPDYPSRRATTAPAGATGPGTRAGTAGPAQGAGAGGAATRGNGPGTQTGQHGNSGRGGRPGAPGRAGSPVAPVPSSRSSKALKWVVSLVVLGAIGLGSWGTAEALLSHNNAGSTSSQLGADPSTQAGGNPNHRALNKLKLFSATEFSPLDPQPIAGDKAPLAIDGDPSTAWITSTYNGYANFGNLPLRKDGSGIVVDLGSVQSVSEVKLTIPITGGQTMEILAAPADATAIPADTSGFTQRISNSTVVSGTNLDSGVLAQPVRTRFVLVRITSLPPDPTQAGNYRGGISEITVLG
ncbi:serine/threonine protein kinase [Streptacidiphilus sp. MAP5-3]|uniref:serine/threonine protein kinase n=1 Tax=unclassified Streptacidiphilus TaxID=2643834 RepID=UPI0035179CA3